MTSLLLLTKFFTEYFLATFFYKPISLQDSSRFKYNCSYFKLDLLIHNTLWNKDCFCFAIGNGIEKPIRNVEGYERQKIPSDPKSLNTKNLFFIRRKFNLTRWLICFTNNAFCPTNIFIFATEFMQFHCPCFWW